MIVIAGSVLTGCGSVSNPDDQLAFSSRQDETDDWDIALIDTAAGTSRALSVNGAFDWGPVFSPDGKRIAFSSDYESGEMEDLYMPDPLNPGAKVHHVQEITGDRDIVVIGVDGSGRQRLTDDPLTDDYPAWSPGGERIAFTSDRTGDVEIFVMDSDGNNVEQLTSNPGEDWMPDWSPDGQLIAFASSHGSEGFEIHVMDANGNNVDQLTDSPGHDWGPAWSPDGQLIAFASQRTGDFEIYVMSADGGNVYQLTDSIGDDFEPIWSPDGQRIAFASSRTGRMEIFVMSSDGNDAEPIGEPGVPSDWFSAPVED